MYPECCSSLSEINKSGRHQLQLFLARFRKFFSWRGRSRSFFLFLGKRAAFLFSDNGCFFVNCCSFICCPSFLMCNKTKLVENTQSKHTIKRNNGCITNGLIELFLHTQNNIEIIAILSNCFSYILLQCYGRNFRFASSH